MARRETAARRYAEAAFELGRGDATLDAWARDLARLREALAIPQVEKERIFSGTALSILNNV